MNSLKNSIANLLNVFRLYPLVIIAAFLASFSASKLIQDESVDDSEVEYFWAKILITALLGISWTFMIAMAQQRYKFSEFLKVLGLVPVALFYFFFFPGKDFDALNFNHFFTLFALPILVHLLVAWTPFIKEEPKGSFWQYNQSLFLNFIIALLFAAVLVGGIEAAVLAIENLFDLSVTDETYMNIFFYGGILGSVLVFLIFVGEGFSLLTQKLEYPVALKFLVQYVFIPLLILYAFILYGYSFKIIITWGLPRGYVSYLVIGFSLFGILALLLVHPLAKDVGKSWVKVFHKVFYYTLLPILALLFVAIGVRIAEYGFTEPRYVVFIFGLWLVFLTVSYIVKPKTSIRLIPFSLSVLVLIALVMPYLNAFSVSERSQEKALINLLEKHNILKNDKWDFNAVVSDSVLDNIESKLSYFAEKSKLTPYSSWVAGNPNLHEYFKENNEYLSLNGSFPNSIKIKGNTYQNSWESWESPMQPIAIGGYSQYMKISRFNDFEFTPLDLKIDLIQDSLNKGIRIKVQQGDKVIKSAYFSDLFPEFWQQIQQPGISELDLNKYALDFDVNGKKLRLQLSHVSINWSNGKLHTFNPQFILLIKE